MKKQILTLTMCLALTATSALANGTKAVTAPVKTPIANAAKTQVKAPVKTAPAAKAINKVTPAATPQAVVKPSDKSQVMTPEEAKKHFEEKKAQERALMYEALKLTEAQKAKAEALDAKTREDAGKYLRKVQTESKKLRDLKAKHASVFAIYKQKWALKSAKADAKKYFAKSKKSFEAILTDEQKVKFNAMHEAKLKEMEKFKKDHKMGPKGPKGPEPMGPPPAGMGPVGPQGPAPMGLPPVKK